MKKFQWVSQFDIRNPACYERVMDALMEEGVGPSKWPSEKVEMDSNSGKGLPGSPNGYGVGYLLASHNDDLGKKKVDYVNSFEASGVSHQRRLLSRVQV